jgi:hypothetical protein
VEENAVADDVAVVADRNILLGAIDGEILEGVDGRVGAELYGVGTLDVDVTHVVRLVEQDGGLAPGLLLGAPVRILTGNYRINVGADL